MRRTHTPAIPPQLYRHFAIVTIVLTLALAMFAEGENGEAARALATQQQAQVPQTPTPPKLVVASSAPQPAGDSGGGGWDLDFGSPMEQLRDGGGIGLFGGDDLAEEAGYSAEYLASLSPAEREMLLKGLEENGMLSPDIRESRASALSAASSRRSGAPSTGD